jgi:putative ABC transport system permease protein
MEIATLWHEFRLALLSILRRPYISAFVVTAIAVGIGTSVVTITLYHAKAGNPIWWKNDVLFRVMLDSRPLTPEVDTSRHPEYPPFTLIYRDAATLYESTIPSSSVMMLASYGLVDSMRPENRPFEQTVRLTTRQFFPMFDVPFLFGHPWDKSADDDPLPVVVISRHLSERLFGSANSIGNQLSFSGQTFTVVGIIDKWLPLPRFYDVGRSFMPSDDLFIPFHWAESLADLHFPGFCQRTQTSLTTFKELAPSECISTALWVELDTMTQRQRYRMFLDNYSRDQLRAERFVRPLNNRLVNVSTWLAMNDVVGRQSKLRVFLALIFLCVCVLNALGLLLAKFMSVAPVTALRRALGATRGDVMREHLIEVLMLSAISGAVGIALAGIALHVIRLGFFLDSDTSQLNPDYTNVAASLSHMDGSMILIAIAMSLLAGLVSGIYPAWRVGRIAPATFLNTQ